MKLKRKNLHKYQRYVIKFVKRMKKCALFLDMGLGKTVISLTAALDLLSDLFVTRVLIVAPLRVANTVWHKELENWAHLRGLTVGICTGTEENRMNVLKTKPDIVVINRDNIRWLIYKVKRRWPWDMVIIDESSSFKNHASQRFAAFRKVRKYINSIVLLTGTPAPNGYHDLWAQIFMIDGGKRLGRNITTFRTKYFNYNPYSQKYVLRDGAEEEIKAKIADICISMDAEDYLDLPPIIYLEEYVKPHKKAQKQYKQLEKEFLLELENGSDIEAPYAASLSNKLLQMCNGFVYENLIIEDELKLDKDGLPKFVKKNKPHLIHDAKIDSLKEIFADNQNENFFIAYNFKEDLVRLKKAFPDAVVLSKSGKELDDWNEGKIKKLLVHPASAGHGLNAQFGGSVIIWFGLTWSLELWQQLNKRLHRQGQTKPVRVISLIAEGWLDETVMRAIRAKAKTQKEILDYVKAELKRKK